MRYPRNATTLVVVFDSTRPSGQACYRRARLCKEDGFALVLMSRKIVSGELDLSILVVVQSRVCLFSFNGFVALLSW